MHLIDVNVIAKEVHGGTLHKTFARRHTTPVLSAHYDVVFERGRGVLSEVQILIHLLYNTIYILP